MSAEAAMNDDVVTEYLLNMTYRLGMAGRAYQIDDDVDACIAYIGEAKNIAYFLARKLDIDLDAAKRVWLDYAKPKGDGVTDDTAAVQRAVTVHYGALDVPAEIMAMHGDIQEAWQEYKIIAGHGLPMTGVYRTLNSEILKYHEGDEPPWGFPVCLARLVSRWEELSKLVQRRI